MASSAKSVVETQVEGDGVEVYQSVETTVNGETVKKESTQPGKLELEMKNNASVQSGAKSIVSTSEESLPVINKKPGFQDFIGLIKTWISRFFGIFTKST